MPLATLSDITIDELTQPADLEALRAEWTALWRRCPTATPFQSPAWLIPCWRHLGEGELWLLALRGGGRLRGLAPLYIYPMPATGRRQVLLLGTGISDYLDALFEPGFEMAGATALFAHLARRAERWDECDFQQLPPDSPLLHFRPSRSPVWRETLREHEPCPALSLPETITDLDRCVPHRMLKHLRYYRRRAEQLGPLHVERADAANLSELLQAHLDLHAARWQARGEGGVLAERAIQAFHREAAPTLLAEGLLRLYALRLGTRLIATLYGLVHGGCFYYYLGGFDPADEALSPGTLAIGLGLEEAIREGLREFDFLRGREPYKYQWGARDRPTWQLTLHRSAPPVAGNAPRGNAP